MNHESANFQFEKEIGWQDLGGGVQRQIMGYNGDLMMVKVKFEAGAVGAPHTHPHTQVTYVASGVFKFTTDGETKVIRTVDTVLFLNRLQSPRSFVFRKLQFPPQETTIS